METTVQEREAQMREAATTQWRDRMADGDIEIDVDARVVLLDEEGPTEGCAWVQAWIWVEGKP